MALNLVFDYSEKLARFVTRAAGTVTAPGTPFITPAGKPAVAITGSGNYVSTQSFADTTITRPAGGVGLEATEVSSAFDGTWEFTGVTGATTTTVPDTVVYITSAGALTLTAGSNTRFGTVDYPKNYVKVAGTLPVKVGN